MPKRRHVKEKEMLRLWLSSLKKNHRIISGESLTTAVTQKAQRKMIWSYEIGAFTQKGSVPRLPAKCHREGIRCNLSLTISQAETVQAVQNSNFQPSVSHLWRSLREGGEKEGGAGEGVRGKASLKTKYNYSVFQPGTLLLLICICQEQVFAFIFALLPSWEAYILKKWEHKRKKTPPASNTCDADRIFSHPLEHTCSQPGHSGLKINDSKPWPNRLRLNNNNNHLCYSSLHTSCRRPCAEGHTKAAGMWREVTALDHTAVLH